MHKASESNSLPPISYDHSLSQQVEVTITPEHIPQIDGYQILELLGQGGMSSVWKAVQLSTRRVVALKLMGGVFFGNERSRARFEREVELASRLNHPNVAGVYDSGLNRGVYYYAMELVEGIHLDQYVLQRQLDQRSILLLLRQICEAVRHAHTHGVIHRDLKPSNILVTPDSQPHIVDFGLAKSTAEHRPGLTISQEGAAAGTVLFMAPEQAAGQTARIGTHSDVYALSVIFYHLLTSRYPHESTGSIHEIQSRVIHQEPRRPREIGVAIDRDLEALVMKGLARDPQHRYTTAGDLAADIQRYLDGEVLEARPLTLGYVLAKRLRKHRAKTSIAAAAALLFATLATYAFVRIAQERNYAQQQANTANRALYINKIARVQDELARNDIGKAIDLLDSCPPELRHWEWHYLRGLADQSISTIKTDAPWVRALQVNSQTKRGMLLSREGVLVWFDLESGRIVNRLQVQRCERAAISEFGDRIAVVDSTSCVILDSHGRQISTIEEPVSSTILQVAFDKTGGTLYLLGTRELKAFDVPTGGLLSRLAFEFDAYCMIVGGDGNLIIGGDGGFEVWDKLLTAQQVSISTASTIIEIAYSTFAHKMATVQTDDAVVLWDTNTWQPEHEWQVEQFESLAITKDGARVITGHSDGALTVYGAPNPSPVIKLQGHTFAARLLANLGETDHLLLSADDSGAIKLWRLTIPSESVRSAELSHEIPIGIATLSKDAGFVIAYGDGTVETWDWSLEKPRVIYSAKTAISALAVVQAKGLILVGRTDGLLVLMNNRGDIQAEHQVPGGGQICSLAIDTEARWLALARTEYATEVRILELAGLIPQALLSASRPMTWLKNQQVLFAALPDQERVGMFAPNDWLMQQSIPVRNSTRLVALIANEGRLIWGDGEGSIVETRYNSSSHETRFLSQGESELSGLVVSGDEKRVFSASRRIKLWDLDMGTELMPLSAGTVQSFVDVTTSSDGIRVLAISLDRVYVWTASRH